MCGICGFAGQGDQTVLDKMMGAMAYRGPDDSGQWHDGKALYLGHLRLSIVDHADGHQPMVLADESLVVVFNGEIYNHRELRRSLEARGWKFRSDHSDTEILLHGYREWGQSLVDRLNGMWAFALFDAQENILFLSRDRVGKKPLYYAQTGETFAFASELSSLAEHPKIRTEVDQLSLMKYFAHGYVPAPSTMLKGVRKLPAGHNLVFKLSGRSYQVERYWRFEFAPDHSWIHREQELGDALVERLFAAVEMRLHADVPVGVFLSGGVDSSSVAALAISVNRTRPVRTYSIGFEEPSFDESAYSNDMASLLGTEHTSDKMSVVRCIELLDNIYPRLDEPMADSSLIPSFLICQIAKTNIKVALTGDGADELFAGYDPFRALNLANTYSRLVPRHLHAFITGLTQRLPVSHRNMSFDFKVKKFLSGLKFDSRIRNPVWLGTLPPGHLSRLFGTSIDPENLYEESIVAWDATGADNDIDRTLQFYMELYLQNDILTKIDRAGMLNSLEVRSPFLDINFVDLVRTIPSHLKFNSRGTKYILKKALANILPVDILSRPKKGFGVPVGQWFHDQMLSIDPEAMNSILDADFIRNLSQEHIDGKADWRSFLWAHFILERWIERPVFSQS